MLELLLMEYERTFGFPFPLLEVEDWAEIEVINLVYDCLQYNDPNLRKRPTVNKFPEAPRSRAVMKSDIEAEENFRNLSKSLGLDRQQ